MRISPIIPIFDSVLSFHEKNPGLEQLLSDQMTGSFPQRRKDAKKAKNFASLRLCGKFSFIDRGFALNCIEIVLVGLRSILIRLRTILLKLRIVRLMLRKFLRA
jgi:hypothetical protein